MRRLRSYTDMGIITTNEEFGIDATNFFNYLSGYMEKPEYHHLLFLLLTLEKNLSS